MNIEKAISEKQGTIVDVRSPAEFFGGNVSGSVNIPLQELMNRMDELKSLKQPLILCCASGNRSGMAEQILSQAGFECGNAGSWLDVQYYAKQA
jgi:rhodanese-related sulfurtransferase